MNSDPVWATVYLAEGRRLANLATVLVGSFDAHDLVVDTVHRAVSRPGWDSVADHGAYLSRALVNASIQRQRSQRRRTLRERHYRTNEHANDPDTPTRIQVQNALRQLTPQQRAIAYFLYWEDLPISAVASRLGVSEGAVRKQLDRTKRRLRNVLKEDVQ